MRLCPAKWRFRVAAAFLALIALPVRASFLELVSPRQSSLPPVAGGGGASEAPIMSPDGRYVLFASTANNLTLMSNGAPMAASATPRLNVFVRDRASNLTTLVSIDLAASGGGNGDSLPAGIATNGQSALFESVASNLVAGDTNDVRDVFVRDLLNGTTTLVSVSTNGWSGNGVSRDAVMTPDGRYVAFVSAACDLVPNDTNGIPDVFVRDLQAHTTALVSVGAVSTNTAYLFSASASPQITPDGRYVVFYSTATNLVPGIDTAGEVYVRDVIAEDTTWVSTAALALFQSVTGGTNEVACNASISDDGQFVAFEACTNSPTGLSARGIILRYNLLTGSTDLVHTNANVPVEYFENIHTLDITPDGRFIAFVANIGNDAGTNTAIYVWDAQSGSSTLASADKDTAGPAQGTGDSPVVSPDGRFVAFISNGTNLTANPLIGEYHLYCRDLLAGTTTLIDVDTNGIGSGVTAATAPSMSADGGSLAFDSGDGALAPNDQNDDVDVFVRDLTPGITGMISDHEPSLPSVTPGGGPSGLTAGSVSADGRYVAFFSQADSLTPNDANGCADVFVRDLMTGTNLPVSLNTNQVTAHGRSAEPSISADGRYVAFSSRADDLVANDTNHVPDVFVRDLSSGTTALVSVGADGMSPGNGESFSPMISGDGCYVLFHSKASNLAPGSFGTGNENLFVRDLQAGTTYALTAGGGGTGVYAASTTPAGQHIAFIGVAPGVAGTRIYVWNSTLAARTYTNSPGFLLGASSLVSISPNGQRLACLRGTAGQLWALDVSSEASWTIQSNGLFLASIAGLQFSSDGRYLAYAMAGGIGTTQNVYLYDLEAGTNLLVSRNPDTLQPANGASDSPVISADGRFVAYRSTATDLGTGDANGHPALFVYDRLNDSTTLLTTAASGTGVGDNRSLTPIFSGDGRTLVFASWASNLSPNDFNHFSDLFAYAFFYADVVAGPGGQGPTVSWPYVPAHTYHVEYKDNLADSSWLPVTGTINIDGNRAFLEDPAPLSGQRFYRVVAE